MRLSESFTKPLREPPKGADSANARFLIQGGFIDQLAAGIYSFLPLGWRVYRKIEQIIREEMNAVGGQELNMPALHPAKPWKASGRWDDPEVREVMYQFEDHSGKPYGLGFTHEEIIAEIGRQFISSYRDLPLSVFQIQAKFRHEPRAKSGLLRGREFMMKDLYSFHEDEKDRDRYYEQVKKAYLKTYKRLGLDAWVVLSPGGVFSKYSDEFQVFAESGEDTIYYKEDRSFAQNAELFEAEGRKRAKGVQTAKTIEVGDIYKLGTRYPEAAGVSFLDQDGKKRTPTMCSYGIGVSRVMGALVEVSHDERGIIWPESVAPFGIHLVSLAKSTAEKKAADKLYDDLTKAGVEVLYDDRDESAGVKFNDADLLGIPTRITISQSTLEKNAVERKARSGTKTELLPLKDAVKTLS